MYILGDLHFRSFIFSHKSPNSLIGGETAQQDAHEFLIHLLEKLKWRCFKEVTLFKKGLRSSKGPSHRQNCLSLGIEGNQTLQQCLDGYFDWERMESENHITIEGKNYTKWKQSVRIEPPLPDYLFVHLKRFDEEGNKIHSPISLGKKRVQIPQETGGHVTYEILGIINHHGISAQSGHYTAHIKNSRDPKKPWVCCNDDRIQYEDPPTPETLAYLFLLKKLLE